VKKFRKIYKNKTINLALDCLCVGARECAHLCALQSSVSKIKTFQVVSRSGGIAKEPTKKIKKIISKIPPTVCFSLVGPVGPRLKARVAEVILQIQKINGENVVSDRAKLGLHSRHFHARQIFHSQKKNRL
jgi:hypothetical protein